MKNNWNEKYKLQIIQVQEWKEYYEKMLREDRTEFLNVTRTDVDCNESINESIMKEVQEAVRLMN